MPHRIKKVSLTATVNSNGEFYYSMHPVKNNAQTFYAFMFALKSFFEKKSSVWRAKTAFMFDNASHPSTPLLMRFYEKSKLKIIFTAPYL